jgi:hypothetical protein
MALRLVGRSTLEGRQVPWQCLSRFTRRG